MTQIEKVQNYYHDVAALATRLGMDVHDNGLIPTPYADFFHDADNRAIVYLYGCYDKACMNLRINGRAEYVETDHETALLILFNYFA